MRLLNGDNMYILGSFTGGRKFNDVAVGSWDSPQDFLNSDYNKDGDGDDESINGYGFKEGYVIETNKDQDWTMSESFDRIANLEEYDFVVNNCATTVQKVMLNAGLKIHKREFWNRINFGGEYKCPIPSIAYEEIMNANQGEKIKRDE